MEKIDVHAHYGLWPFAGKCSTAGESFKIGDFRKEMHRCGIAAMIISSAKAIMYDFTEGNSELFEAIDGEKGLYGYVVINANYVRESLDEIKKYMHHDNFAGVKFHPEYCGLPFDCEQMKPVLEFVEKNGIPVLVHTFGDGISSPMKLANVNAIFPEALIISAHMGGPGYETALSMARKTNRNIYLEICSTDQSSDKIARAVEAAGEDNVLFGTDYSLINPFHTIGAMESAGFSDEVKRKIYMLNAKRLFERYVRI